jgi:membrane associated rhomboid family serine protease
VLFPYRDENPSYSFPFFTVILIGVNVVIYFLMLGSGGIDFYAARLGFIPSAIIEKPMVIFSSILLHANLLHLITNMWFLWLFGDNIEDRFGRLPYFLLFVFSGFAGNITHGIFTLFSSDVPVIGASGAVAGVMGSYLARFPTSRIRCVLVIIFYPVFVKIPAYFFIGAWIIWEFVAVYVAPSSHIAHWAHIGGFIFGFLWAIRRQDKPDFPKGAWGLDV